MCAWHVDVLRVQHASIADALSGKRLDTLTECVAMAVDGVDPDDLEHKRRAPDA